MSAYGKVSYTESDNQVVESVTDRIESSAVEKQVEKFDTSFNAERLQQLYAEYDKITIDEERIDSLTQIKANAMSKAMPFRLVLGVTTTAIVTILLAFLCIYNVFVINVKEFFYIKILWCLNNRLIYHFFLYDNFYNIHINEFF